MGSRAKHQRDRALSIYRKLLGARGLDEAELWQHALFFAMPPQERCHFSLKTSRSAFSLRRSGKRAAHRDKDIAVLPILQRTLRLARRLTRRPVPARERITRRKKK
jgi:hypothetical protein